MAPRRCCCGTRLLLLRLVLLLLQGASASAGAAPPCSSSPPSVDSVQGLARRASVVIEAPSALVPSPSLPSPSPPPVSWVTRVRVHQVWPAKSGGLRKDGLLWVLLAERGSACGSSLKEESRYIFFMEPVVASSVNNTGAPSLLPPSPPSPLFRASSPPLETGRSLKKEVGRALCTRGCATLCQITSEWLQKGAVHIKRC
ncbi:pro-neuregulin-2, membrane-bound isoform-like [Lacerta agilis]|uniref:pro-neuregulin-2, membrane-bound isoform-like n=1 Tax=Lacerta agilis TaxID=80427 RepID=UPI001419A950|nr:pro-neuregulin-2, membrane-bound isoform-like [Lacerta agilis]